MIYCSSDWHGCSLDDIKSLLKKAEFKKSDYLFVLGDVIDRGENGVNLLRWLMLQPNIQLLMGNHEAMMLSCKFVFDEITEENIASLDENKMKLLMTWSENGGIVTMKELRELNARDRGSCLDLIDFVEDLPLYETVRIGDRDFLLCHSGIGNFSTEKKLSEYSADDWLWCRPDLEDRYFDSVMTVFGHTPTKYYAKAYSGGIIKTDTWIDIDTGDKPCLLRLDDMKEFYI